MPRPFLASSFVLCALLAVAPVHPREDNFGYPYYNFELSVDGDDLCYGNPVGVPFRFHPLRTDPALELLHGSAQNEMHMREFYCTCLTTTTRVCAYLDWYSYGGGMTNCNMYVTAQMGEPSSGFSVLVDDFMMGYNSQEGVKLGTRVDTDKWVVHPLGPRFGPGGVVFPISPHAFHTVSKHSESSMFAFFGVLVVTGDGDAECIAVHRVYDSDPDGFEKDAAKAGSTVKCTPFGESELCAVVSKGWTISYVFQRMVATGTVVDVAELSVTSPSMAVGAPRRPTSASAGLCKESDQVPRMRASLELQVNPAKQQYEIIAGGTGVPEKTLLVAWDY